MAAPKKVAKKECTSFSCTSCGASFSKWQGKCDACGEWNTLEAQENLPVEAAALLYEKPISLAQITIKETPRLSSGITELDRILGGGFVLESVMLLGGSPGIGKSTLTMQIAQSIANTKQHVLYVSGEESQQQIVFRAQRLGEKSEHISLLIANDIDIVCQHISHLKPDVVILDSIQVMQSKHLSAMSGSVTQVRCCADLFIRCIKKNQGIGIMIGHITRDGNLAGPKVLEHMVDSIFYLEGDHRLGYRLLRAHKNRYFATDEVGLFEMKKEGLKELKSISNYFIDTSTLKYPGTAIAAVEQGSRSLLVEVQALVVGSGLAAPKRHLVGVDVHRANLMIATLEKNCGITLGNKDIFISLIGGLKIQEAALDLAICVAILSSLSNTVLPMNMGIIGEVGLCGELRPVSQIKQRLIEFERLGFTQCLLPKANEKQILTKSNLSLHFISHLSQIVEKFDFKNEKT